MSGFVNMNSIGDPCSGGQLGFQFRRRPNGYIRGNRDGRPANLARQTVHFFLWKGASQFIDTKNQVVGLLVRQEFLIYKTGTQN
jgi:hypothetical protein